MENEEDNRGMGEIFRNQEDGVGGYTVLQR